jgi:Ca2+-binding EF-hand superfamily protein
MIGLEQIDSEVEAHRRFEVEQRAKADALAKQAAERLLAKYDRNHNGIIDSDEKEEAMGDPAFIESELDIIDANHNGELDAEEIAYFDSNNNKTLEPNEQAGIEIAQHLMAERLLREFDENRDGLLDRFEFNELVRSTREANAGQEPSDLFELEDANHDGHIDLAELETYLQWQTYAGLVSRGQPNPIFYSRSRMAIKNSADFQQRFKTAAESYWRDPHGVSSRYSRP